MKGKHVLLVRPKYYTVYPPFGLLKLSAYRKKLGDTTEFVVGTKTTVRAEPNIIYITSLFTWSWEPVWEAVRYYSLKFPNAELWRVEFPDGSNVLRWVRAEDKVGEDQK